MLQLLQLSWGKKRAILDDFQLRNVVGGLQFICGIANWATSTLYLAKVPSYGTIIRILRDNEQVVMKLALYHVNRKANLHDTKL